MLLATLGITGLLAYNAAQRMQEFGVRVALGASRRNLLGLVVRYCLRLSSTGIAIGVIASLMTTRSLSALLYDTSPSDPVTFITIAVILMLVALAAAMIPAWRVMHVDPVRSRGPSKYGQREKKARSCLERKQPASGFRRRAVLSNKRTITRSHAVAFCDCACEPELLWCGAFHPASGKTNGA